MLELALLPTHSHTIQHPQRFPIFMTPSFIWVEQDHSLLSVSENTLLEHSPVSSRSSQISISITIWWFLIFAISKTNFAQLLCISFCHTFGILPEVIKNAVCSSSMRRGNS